VSALAATLRIPRLRGGDYKWVILAVGLAAQTAISSVRQGLPSLAPALRDTYSLSLQELGLALASINVGIVLTLFVWGVLADRIGERHVLAVGLAGASAALVGAALAPTFPWLLAALLVAGMAGASAIGGSGRAVMGWFERSERGMALGVRQTGVPLGGGIAAIALPLVVALFSLRAALLLVAVGCVAAAVASWRWMRDPPPAPAGRVAVVAPPPHRDRRIWRLGLGSSFVVMAQGALFGFLVVFLHDVHGWPVAAAAGGLAVLYIGGAFARIAAGRWSDRLDERVAPLRRLTALSSVFLLAAAGLGAAAAPTALLLPVLLAGGVLAASWNGLSLTAATEMSGRERAGTAIGVQNTILNGAGAIAPVAFASVVVATSWPASWALLAACQLVGVAILGPLVAEERGRREIRRARQRARRTCNASGVRPQGSDPRIQTRSAT
jgi:sugar phosphate permease